MMFVIITCILQTLHDFSIKHKLLHDISSDTFSNVFSHLGLPFSDELYAEVSVKPSSLIRYLTDILDQIKETNVDLIKEQCWILIRERYCSHTLSDKDVKRVWSVFIHLADEQNFPPCLTEENYSIFYTLPEIPSRMKHYKSLSFQHFLNIFTDQGRLDKAVTISNISVVHKLVVENEYAGWLQMKCVGNKKIQHFQRYWLTFENKIMRYFNVEKSISVACGSIQLSNLHQIRLVRDNRTKQSLLVLSTVCGLKFQLKPLNNSNACKMWLQLLKKNKEISTTIHLPEMTKKEPQKESNKTQDKKENNSKLPEISRVKSDPKNVVKRFLKTNVRQKERWEPFISLRRNAKCGKSLMISRTRMIADIPAGQYKLPDIMPVRDLPPLIPKHTVIKNIQWISKVEPDVSGKLIFPSSFDEVVATENATSEFLSYYGCAFAETSSLTVSLPFRHGIQDFTYKKEYLEDYVLDHGAGLEKHDFTHLDCPLDENSGVMILGEIFDEEKIHITAFRIPPRHTLFIPGGCIHSNDYLQGTWRTMLSDESDINHVLLVKKINANQFRKFHFKFM